MQYLDQGQTAPAQAQLEALQAAAPEAAQTALLAAEMAWRENRVRAAAAFASAAAQAPADDPALACDVVSALLRAGVVVAARQYLLRHADTAGVPVAFLLRMADFRLGFGEYTESLALLERALALRPDAAEVHFYRGRLLTFLGRFEAAESAYRDSLRLAPALGEAALALALLRTQAPDHNCLDVVEVGSRDVRQGSRAHAAFEFARYKVLSDLRRYDAAWEALAGGNAIMSARTRDNARLQEAGLERSCAYVATHPLPPSAPLQAGPQPIFIVGLPRSGTTLLERLIGNHSQVTAAGELFDLGRQLQWCADQRSIQDAAFFHRAAGLDMAELGRRYLAQTQWRAHDTRWFIDKQTSNWMLAGWIHAALPGARILHMVRQPLDVCFSIYRAQFGDAYAVGNDLQTLARHYRSYERLMARWRVLAPDAILDVAYADLVRDPEATVRRVLAHCNLAWEPACADLAANREPVATLSAAQVRQPLRAQPAGAWRPYAEPLQPLVNALAEKPAA